MSRCVFSDIFLIFSQGFYSKHFYGFLPWIFQRFLAKFLQYFPGWNSGFFEWIIRGILWGILDIILHSIPCGIIAGISFEILPRTTLPRSPRRIPPSMFSRIIPVFLRGICWRSLWGFFPIFYKKFTWIFTVISPRYYSLDHPRVGKNPFRNKSKVMSGTNPEIISWFYLRDSFPEFFQVLYLNFWKFFYRIFFIFFQNSSRFFFIVNFQRTYS